MTNKDEVIATFLNDSKCGILICNEKSTVVIHDFYVYPNLNLCMKHAEELVNIGKDEFIKKYMKNWER